MVRRRRDEAAGAPSSGSRVDPLPIAPCRAGRRRSTVVLYCCSSRTIGCQTTLPFASTHPASRSSCCCIAFPMVRRETPHLARSAGGAWSYRSVPSDRGTLGRSLRPPGSCTTSICIERSVARHARPARLGFQSHHLPNLLHAEMATHLSLRVAEPDREGIRTGSRRADRRAPARGGPARAGMPWTVDSGEGALHHVIGRTLGLR